MIVAYTELPAPTASGPRPLLDVTVGDLASVLVPCLLDSGAVNSLLPDWVADVAGIDTAGIAPRRLGVGGRVVEAQFTTVTLSAAELTWEASVGFCDRWPYAWGLLGHDSFFRWFTVTFRAADFEFELSPVRG